MVPCALACRRPRSSLSRASSGFPAGARNPSCIGSARRAGGVSPIDTGRREAGSPASSAVSRHESHPALPSRGIPTIRPISMEGGAPLEPLSRKLFHSSLSRRDRHSAIPEALWWTVALICLHAHWTLLRPCRVEIPVTLDPDELELWRRLLEVEITTLEGLRGRPGVESAIEIVATGPRLSPPVALPDSGRCAAAFSGGKDSLLQAAMLAELTERADSRHHDLSDAAVGGPRRRGGEERSRTESASVFRFSWWRFTRTFALSWDNHFADRQGYSDRGQRDDRYISLSRRPFSLPVPPSAPHTSSSRRRPKSRRASSATDAFSSSSTTCIRLRRRELCRRCWRGAAFATGR